MTAAVGSHRSKILQARRFDPVYQNVCPRGAHRVKLHRIFIERLAKAHHRSASSTTSDSHLESMAAPSAAIEP